MDLDDLATDQIASGWSAEPYSRLLDSGLTPKVDTNEPGLRRILMDRGGEIFQARDCAGHPEWILQAGDQGFESP